MSLYVPLCMWTFLTGYILYIRKNVHQNIESYYLWKLDYRWFSFSFSLFHSFLSLFFSLFPSFPFLSRTQLFPFPPSSFLPPSLYRFPLFLLSSLLSVLALFPPFLLPSCFIAFILYFRLAFISLFLFLTFIIFALLWFSNFLQLA